MARRKRTATVTAVAQVHTGVITAVDATPSNNTFTVTIGGEAISVVGTVDVATTATALRAALNSATAHPYFTAITWSGSAGNIIGTADTAGVPFTAALTKTGAGTGTVTDFAVTTANAGPWNWVAGNFSGAALPASSDIVDLLLNATPLLFDLDQNTVTLAELNVDLTAQHPIGLNPLQFQTSGTGANTAKTEYREDYLRIGATLLNIGRNLGGGTVTGFGRCKIDTVSAACAAVVFNSNLTPDETNLPTVRLLFNHASSTLTVHAGSVGVAVDSPDETSTLATVYAHGGSVWIGSGVTLTTFNAFGGTHQIACGLTTLHVEDGTHVITGAGAFTTIKQLAGTVTNHSSGVVTTLSLNGGTYKHNGVGTITTADVTGTLELADGTGAVTISTCNVYPGATINDPNGRLPANTDFVFKGGAQLGVNVTLVLGVGRTVRKQA